MLVTQRDVRVVILGSGFSPAFADVIFLTDAAIILIVLLAVFMGRIGPMCSAVLHRASVMLACLIAHIGAKRR